jgi:hypothetical protein
MRLILFSKLCVIFSLLSLVDFSFAVWMLAVSLGSSRCQGLLQGLQSRELVDGVTVWLSRLRLLLSL